MIFCTVDSNYPLLLQMIMSMRNISRHTLLHIFIWAAIILIGVTDSIMDKDSVLLNLIRVSGALIVFYVNYLILMPKLFLKRRILPYVFSAFALIFISGELENLIEDLDYFADVYDDPFHLQHEMDGISFLIYTVFFVVASVIKLYGVWNKNEVDRQDVENQKNVSELTALKNQINPHFLFNSLNSICSLAVKKSDETPEAIIMLSDMMRYMLYQSNDDFVLLKKEIDYLENYVNLQKLRLANKEYVSFLIQGDVNAKKIPPLLLIAFVENAFKYGVDGAGVSKVNVLINVEEEGFQFVCENVIGKRSHDEECSGIGLENTKKRLKLLYPHKHELSITEEEKMYKVDLRLTLN